MKGMLFKASVPSTLEILLTAGADIEELNAHDMTPLMYHTRFKDLDAVKFLISKGADVDKGNKYLNKLLRK